MSSPAKAPKSFNFQTRDFHLHAFQEQAWYALENKAIREIALLAGIQGGKTVFGALATVKQIGILSKRHPGCNFIVAADTYKTLSQATVPTLTKIIDHSIGFYNQGRQEIQLKVGGKIFLRTSTQPYSVEGIQDCAFAWIDEAGKCSKIFQVNVLGRVARLQGRVLYTSTPYAMNWLYEDVEKPFLDGSRKDIELIRFSSADNPAFPREEFERQKEILDPRTFRMKYMGIHERMQGLVYDLEDSNKVHSFILERGTRYFLGIDWGFAEGHEFALVVRAVTPDGRRYDVDEFKGSGLDPQQQIDICKAKARIYHAEMAFCDPARPDMIALLNKAGVSAIGFHQGKENMKRIQAGITEHYKLMKSGMYQVFTDLCPNLLDEYETYHWPEWDQEKKPKENPVQVNDHVLDAVRYVTVGTMQIQAKKRSNLLQNQVQPTRDFWNPAKSKKEKKSWEAY